MTSETVLIFNPFKLFSVALLIITFSSGPLGQDSPKPVLIDEFPKIVCEDLLARNDAFLTELANNPQDMGYAIFYANDRYSTGFVRFLQASLFVRRFDRTRMEIVLASNPDKREVLGAFWRVPPGANPPPFDRVEIPGPDVSKPFVAGETFMDNVCPTFSPDLFAKLVLETPGSRARLVISGPSSSWRRSTADEELEMFGRYTKLPRNRIELYFVHRPNEPYTSTQYWFIPGKKR